MNYIKNKQGEYYQGICDLDDSIEYKPSMTSDKQRACSFASKIVADEVRINLESKTGMYFQVTNE